MRDELKDALQKYLDAVSLAEKAEKHLLEEVERTIGSEETKEVVDVLLEKSLTKKDRIQEVDEETD